MTDDQLRARYDDEARQLLVGDTNAVTKTFQRLNGAFYLDELARREAGRLNGRMLTLTWIVTIVSGIALVVAIVSLLVAIR